MDHVLLVCHQIIRVSIFVNATFCVFVLAVRPGFSCLTTGLIRTSLISLSQPSVLIHVAKFQNFRNGWRAGGHGPGHHHQGSESTRRKGGNDSHSSSHLHRTGKAQMSRRCQNHKHYERPFSCRRGLKRHLHKDKVLSMSRAAVMAEHRACVINPCQVC